MKLIAVGGKNRDAAHAREEWARHECGIIAEVDLTTGELRKVAEYHGRPEHMPDEAEASVIFKAATLQDDRLIACTTTAIVEFDVNTWAVTREMSHPWFNDVHHVLPSSKGTLLVANTGLDMVMELTWEGECLRHWFVVEGSDWNRFDRQTDYRRLASTKPHLSHPNFVIELDGEVWATRFSQKDAICLSNLGLPRFDISVGSIHDGVVRGAHVWFTAVNGFISVHERATGHLVKQVDLNQFGETNKALGWCRSIEILPDGRPIVGFSRLRPTKLKENLHWLSHKIGLKDNAGVLPTRFWVLDVGMTKVEQEFSLEDVGLNAVFSLHRL